MNRFALGVLTGAALASGVFYHVTDGFKQRHVRYVSPDYTIHFDDGFNSRRFDGYLD